MQPTRRRSIVTCAVFYPLALTSAGRVLRLLGNRKDALLLGLLVRFREVEHALEKRHGADVELLRVGLAWPAYLGTVAQPRVLLVRVATEGAR